MSKYKRIIVNGKRIREHRHIMQEHLGRKLRSDEIVHHIDGDILNNVINNLQIMTRGKHVSLHVKGKPRPDQSERMMGDKNPMKRSEVRSKITGKKHLNYGKIGSKNPNWIKGEVCKATIYNRRYKAWKRIKEGRGILEDFMIMKNTGGFIKN